MKKELKQFINKSIKNFKFLLFIMIGFTFISSILGIMIFVIIQIYGRVNMPYLLICIIPFSLFFISIIGALTDIVTSITSDFVDELEFEDEYIEYIKECYDI